MSPRKLLSSRASLSLLSLLSTRTGMSIPSSTGSGGRTGRRSARLSVRVSDPINYALPCGEPIPTYQLGDPAGSAMTQMSTLIVSFASRYRPQHQLGLSIPIAGDHFPLFGRLSRNRGFRGVRDPGSGELLGEWDRLEGGEGQRCQGPEEGQGVRGSA